jgi:hypothetical protein
VRDLAQVAPLAQVSNLLQLPTNRSGMAKPGPTGARNLRPQALCDNRDRASFERHDNEPTSIADACLVRLAELHEPWRLQTLPATSASTGGMAARR